MAATATTTPGPTSESAALFFLSISPHTHLISSSRLPHSFKAPQEVLLVVKSRPAAGVMMMSERETERGCGAVAASRRRPHLRGATPLRLPFSLSHTHTNIRNARAALSFSHTLPQKARHLSPQRHTHTHAARASQRRSSLEPNPKNRARFLRLRLLSRRRKHGAPWVRCADGGTVPRAQARERGREDEGRENHSPCVATPRSLLSPLTGSFPRVRRFSRPPHNPPQAGDGLQGAQLQAGARR